MPTLLKNNLLSRSLAFNSTGHMHFVDYSNTTKVYYQADINGPPTAVTSMLDNAFNFAGLGAFVQRFVERYNAFCF